MQRRDFLTMTGATMAGALTARAAKTSADRPNLLIIHTDEHNFRTLGCYRAVMPAEQAFVWGKGVAVETPHIDWIAKNGALCMRFYANSPVCSPSRSALVSGRYSQNTPVVTNNIPMDDAVVTFAETLRRAGYATGYAGKWHLDGNGKPQWAPKRQFGFADNRYMFNRGHWKQLEDTPTGPRVKARKAGKPTYSVAGADEKSFTTDFLCDKTVEFIQKHKAGPFCYMVSIPDPHGPNTVRPPYDTMFRKLTFHDPKTMHKPDSATPAWGAKQTRAINSKQMQLYFGMVKCVDDNVGKILKALRAAGILEKTIVIFTSDHGDLCGEHGRHNKGVPYEASAKIPFVIHYPGRIQPGTVIHEALSCVDFLPTILRLMGVKTAGKEQGRCAAALFTTGKAPDNWQDVVFLRQCNRSVQPGNWLAAVTKRHKLVISGCDVPWLIDLKTDPDEVKNLLGDPAHRETIRTLGTQLLDYGQTFKDPYLTQPRIKADLEWAVSDAQGYTAPKGVPQPKPTPSGRNGKKRRGKRTVPAT